MVDLCEWSSAHGASVVKLVWEAVMTPTPDQIREVAGTEGEKNGRNRRMTHRPYSHKLVPGSGPLTAELLFLGEAPGKDEDRWGEPLIGKVGWLFSQLLKTVGIERAECRLDNVFPYRPTNNKIDLVSKEDLEYHFTLLHEKIEAMPNLKVLVPMGNYALYALTGEGLVKWLKRVPGDKKPGIMNLRGTVFAYWDKVNRRQLKVIPTLHPGYLVRDMRAVEASIYDLERVKENLTFEGIRRLERDLVIGPSLSAVDDLAHRFSQHDEPIGYDIENPARKGSKAKPIVCMSFSDHSQYAMTIPTTKAYWGSYLSQVIETIGYIMRLPNPKCTQNGIYDHFCLEREWGFRPTNWTLDTLALSHCNHAAQWKHSLEFLASIFTDEPFWKDEAKDSALSNQWAGNVEQFWTYCAKDSAVMYEIMETLWAILEENGRLDFYLQHYAPLFDILLTLSTHGMLVDDATRRRRLMDCQATCIELQDEVSRLAGMQLYSAKSLSGAKIKEYLYERLRLPIRKIKDKKTGEMSVTSNEVTIRKFMLKFPEQVGVTGKMILDHTRIDTLSRFYKAERLDDDGRMRSEYWMNTEEGRLKSKKNALGTGSNAQNVDREARDVYLADPGCLALSIDYSQIESRIVDLWLYWLTGKEGYLERAMSKPWERDNHHETAQLVHPHLDLKCLKETDEKEYKKVRYLGKKARHALPRGLGAETLQGELLKDGHVFDITETKQFLTNLMKAEPEHLNYFQYIENEIKRTRCLTNSWGRELKFPWDRVEGEGAHLTFQRGYSFHPQSEAWDLLLIQGIRPFDEYLKQYPERARVNAYIHDEIFFSAEPETAYETACFLRERMEAPHEILGVDFSCWVSLTVGSTWEGDKEFKRWPSREEFEAEVAGAGV